MPRREKVELVSQLRGVNLLPDPTVIADNEFRKLRNFYPARGSVRILAKRPGSTKYNSSAIASVTRLDNGIRAWLASGTKKLIVAANLAAGDALYVGDDSLGTFAAITGGTAPSANQKWFFLNWPLLGKVYAACGDGATPIAISSDFATKSDMTIGAGSTDARFGQFMTTFRQRLITAKTPTNPTYTYFFDAASDSVCGASSFWRINEPVTALGKNTFGTTTQSLREMLVVAGAHSLWFVAGDTSTAIEQASNVIGCKSPKSMVNTPLGLMFLGSDRMVYLLRSDPREPERVGQKIYPDLLNIPEAQLADVAAVYHNGFYKLSYSASGGATNTLQYWADLLPALVGQPEIDWYGPMDNVAVLAFVLLDGPNDPLSLYGCDDTAGTVWKLDQANVFTDGATTITGEITTKEFNEGDPLRQKIWPGFVFGYLRSASGTLQVTATVDSGGSTYNDTLTWTLTGAVWDTAVWDTDVWGGQSFQEEVLNWDERIVGRTVQLNLVHAVAADFQLRDFTRKARVIPRML